MTCVLINDGYLMVQVCTSVSIYGRWVVGKASQWCLMDVGTCCRWRSGLGRLLEHVVWLLF